MDNSENKSIQSDLIRGHIDTIILKSLSEGDKYGYEICREVEIKSGGNFVLKQPTLYSSLKRLENQNYISAYWGELTKGARRKYYKITQEGKDFLNKNRDSWEYSRNVIDALVSGDSQNLIQNNYENNLSDSNLSAEDKAYTSVDVSADALSVTEEEKPVSEAQTEETSQKKYDAVIIKNNQTENHDNTSGNLSKLSAELREEIAKKFNEAKAYAVSKLAHNAEGNIDPLTWKKNNVTQAATDTSKIESEKSFNLDENAVKQEIESDQYKNKLEKIFELKKSAVESQPQTKTELDNSPAQSNAETSEKEAKSVAMAIRYHQPSLVDKDTYYVYSNKFRVAYYSVLSFIILVQILICHAVFNSTLGIHIESGYYLSAGLIAVLLPFYSFIFYFYDTDKKKKVRYNLKHNFAKKSLIFFECVAVIFLVLLIVDKNLFASLQNFAKAILPLILSSNFLLSAPIAKLMYKLKVFAVNA